MATKAANPDDVLRLGSQVASIKANMPKKRWSKFVKLAHKRGFTVGAALSDRPDSLKERTASSLREEARKTVASAYAPATKALSQREAAIGHLDAKRKADDASYRTWLTGETEKLHAQAAAADATLNTQQGTIAAETKTAIEAARADSLKRMGATAGTVSDPTQSTALDTSAADVASTNRIAAAREQTAAITKIGGDSRELAKASLLAQQAAREASRQGDTWKALGELATDRSKLTAEQGAATLDKTDELLSRNASIAQSNIESDLASASLGLKEKDLAASIDEANRKYKVETAKFGLAEWKAKNAAKVEAAKIELGYDRIASQDGRAAADRKLKEKLEGIRSDDRRKERERLEKADAKDGKGKAPSIKQAERDIYRTVETVRGLFVRWDKNNAVPLEQREQHLIDQGYDKALIDVARSLARNNGVMDNATRIKARQLGIPHSAYFWPVPSNKPQKSGDAGR